MNKLSISIDMGAKNNGVFIVKTKDEKLLDKKATCIIIEKNSINFSKKSRRENRHKDRNYKRRKLVKRLLPELLNLSKYNEKQIQLIYGLLNNRGYTFISTSTEFEKLNDVTVEFISKYFDELKGLCLKEDFEGKVSTFDNLDELKDFIELINVKIDNESKKKKDDFYKEFQDNLKLIKDDLKLIKNLFSSIQSEIETGSKPRAKYFDEIKQEIENSFDFIDGFTKIEFFNLIGNISNFQLRILRKYFNNKFDNILDIEKLNQKIRAYFKAFHFKSEKEKKQKKELFQSLDIHQNIIDFLKNTNPLLTIPPYEDMNNRDTYKCNSMLIKADLITNELKNSIDYLLRSDYFSSLLIGSDGEFKKEELIKTKPSSNNIYLKIDLTYSKYLQRILDVKIDDNNKEFHPRLVYKNKNAKTIELFKKLFGENIYKSLKKIAESYYDEEIKIYNGIYEASTSIFEKCNTNTSYKNNVKELLLKPLYSYSFTQTETIEYTKEIENYKEKINRSTLLGFLKFVEEEYKKYQNSFYHVVQSNFEIENKKDIKDKDIKKLLDGLDSCVLILKQILEKLKINTYFNEVDNVNNTNLSRILNILKQTYNILFYDLSGFSKTCKSCTKENSIRSDENFTIAKRLLSDVAKPIDGMLDMMLDRLAFEITQEITDDDIKDCNNLEILLEQNRFEFEENLSDIKRANDSSIKRYKPKLKVICPYTGESFDKGEYDHILPQSKEVYNSKANMIYCSSKGNREKSNTIYNLENLNKKHLKELFNTDDLTQIKIFISKNIKTINEKEFKNFDNLKLDQQKAFRYALFMSSDSFEYKKAFNLVKIDKIKTFSNGTQKRLARFIYEKLVKKFPANFKNNQIHVDSKSIDSMLVSATRKSLSSTNEELKKEKFQESHSHCIDAMIVFYLGNLKIEGRADKKINNLSTLKPIFTFEDIYLKESTLNNLTKNVTYINTIKKEIGSYKLFDDTIYSEHYRHITIENSNKKDLEVFIKNNLLFKNENNKKVFVKEIEELEPLVIYKLDVQRVSNILHKFFNENNKTELLNLKILDKLQYFTSRKEIINIFFDEKRTKLLKFNEIKNIPYFSSKLYKAIYEKLENETTLFKINEDNKTILNNEVLNHLQIDMFQSKQKEENKEVRKRDKKRHKYTLPILGSPKFRIKRGQTWQVLGNKDIATKNYIINGDIKPIAFFSQNTIPLKVLDLLDCLLIDENTKNIYEVNVNTDELNKYINSLKYLVTEAKRCTIIVSFIKNSFTDINFDEIKQFDATKDEMFKKLIENYIDNKESNISKYIGSIRDSIKAKAILIGNDSNTISIQYKAAITASKKKIILDNLK